MEDNQSRELWLSGLGGYHNIVNISRCSSRVFVQINNEDLVLEDELVELDGVEGIQVNDYQVVLTTGADTESFYRDLQEVVASYNVSSEPDQSGRKFMDYVNIVGKFSSEIFMPIVPALITGGVLSALNILLINYLGIAADSGLARLFDIIFQAAFSMLPVYLGYTVAHKLKLEPILGALLGAILVSPGVSGVVDMKILGLAVTPVDYSGSIVPIVLGVFLLYYVDGFFEKILPDIVKYLLKPFLSMLIVVPITLLWLGPIGTVLSTYVGNFILWLMDTAGFIALPILSALYPYMVMFGIDKALYPIGFNALAEIGYDPIIMVMGFVSNLCVGASALAVSRGTRGVDTEQRGAYLSFGFTGLMGITEPAFYGALIGRPKALMGTAIGALAGGLVAGLFSLSSYVVGGAPGLLTILFFLSPDGSFNNFMVAIIVAVVSIVVSYIATFIIVKQLDL